MGRVIGIGFDALRPGNNIKENAGRLLGNVLPFLKQPEVRKSTDWIGPVEKTPLRDSLDRFIVALPSSLMQSVPTQRQFRREL